VEFTQPNVLIYSVKRDSKNIIFKLFNPPVIVDLPLSKHKQA
jgi:hypothetical protein